MQENICKRVMIGFSFTSNCMKSGVRFLSQLCSAVGAKPISFHHCKEKHSKIKYILLLNLEEWVIPTLISTHNLVANMRSYCALYLL